MLLFKIAYTLYMGTIQTRYNVLLKADVKMNKYYKYYKYIRIQNPEMKAYRVLEFVKTMEKKGYISVLGIAQ